MIIESQSVQHIFFWKEDGVPSLQEDSGTWEFAELGFGSTQQALLFLRRFGALSEFRSLLTERFPGQVHRWQIAELLGKVADLMVKKRLCVQKRWKRATAAVATHGEATKVARRDVAEKSDPREPPTFLPNHDGPNQAATLADAASGGEPFCEECEKARAQMAEPQAPAEPHEPSFPPDHDNDAQAKSLIDASKDGTPFCEECAKAQAQQAA